MSIAVALLKRLEDGFQLFRFEVIGEHSMRDALQRYLGLKGFQLFRFEVIGERNRAAGSRDFNVWFPTIPI